MKHLKDHSPSGSTVFTDCHSSYISWANGKSKIGALGYYHYWINHSEYYVHEKFPFVMTGRIENLWRQLKSSFSNLKFN